MFKQFKQQIIILLLFISICSNNIYADGFPTPFAINSTSNNPMPISIIGYEDGANTQIALIPNEAIVNSFETYDLYIIYNSDFTGYAQFTIQGTNTNTNETEIINVIKPVTIGVNNLILPKWQPANNTSINFNVMNYILTCGAITKIQVN